nr:unnamed protein product [Naegleria fowleri]
MSSSSNLGEPSVLPEEELLLEEERPLPSSASPTTNDNENGNNGNTTNAKKGGLTVSFTSNHAKKGPIARKSKLEVSKSSSNIDTDVMTPLSSIVEHSFLPNPVVMQQATEEFEEKVKEKEQLRKSSSSGFLPGTTTPFSPPFLDLAIPTPTPMTAVPGALFVYNEDAFKADLEDFEDESQLLEQIRSKEACFAEEYINDEIVQVCSNLFKVLEMRRKHQVGEYSEESRRDARPWNCFYHTEDFVGNVDEDELLLNSRSHAYVEPKQTFDPYDLDACKHYPVTSDDTISMRKGIFYVKNTLGQEIVPPVTFEEHFETYKFLSNLMYDAPTKSFCYTRLNALELKFTLFKKLKQFEEIKTQKLVPHRDWYNVRKVDGHVHLSSMAHQKHLLRYIKRKLKQCPDEVVIVRDGKKLTLAEVFDSLNLTPFDLSVDTLDVHVDKTQTMHRFDKFNLKYSPFGQSRLREIFLKTDNMIEGKYFAEMTREVFRDYEDSRYQHAEPRVSIYGKQYDEWQNLSKWVIKQRMYSPNIRWLIQIPRLYNVHKQFNAIESFEQMLYNIFNPLFEATRCPDKYPEISTFLNYIVGFDSVDDESKPEPRFHMDLPTPDEWKIGENPPYAYYSYYFYANIKVLNAYRKSKGLNTFAIRPHAGEAGNASHLVSAYLLSDEINHGIELRKAPVLQYLYYLSQVGLAMSPLSNNSLFLSYEKNPFPQFFQRGLNVALSTDDPLMFHFTREPLMEEYSIAAQVYHLTNVDLCEIARNSVIQSGFEDVFKKYWLGTTRMFGRNDIRQSNVPNLRLKYRFETLFDEHLFIQKALAVDYLKKKVKGAKYVPPPPMPPAEVLAYLLRDKPSYLALTFSSIGSLANYPAITSRAEKPSTTTETTRKTSNAANNILTQPEPGVITAKDNTGLYVLLTTTTLLLGALALSNLRK